MHKFSPRLLVAVCAAASFAGSAAAQTDSRVGTRPEETAGFSSAGLWMLGLLAQADDESSRGSALSFGYGIGASTWLSGLFTASSSPAERADISADTFVIGVDHRFEHVGFGFEFEDWGESGAVESRDYAASVSWFNERFEARFGLERRAIDITFALTLADRVFTREVSLHADGATLGLRLRANERVRVFYDLEDFDYSRDLTVLPRIQNLNRLNGSALTLANSFVADRRTLGVDVAFGARLVSVTWSEDSSAVDSSELSSLGVALMLPARPRLDVELSLGRSDSNTLAASTYVGIGVLIYGGAGH